MMLTIAKALYTSLIILASILFSSCSLSRTNEDVSHNIALADPFILLHDDTYYAYGTNSDDGFEVYYSKNLVEWKRHPELALDKKNNYGEKWFWAPEVYYNSSDKKFYFYYSSEEHIAVATSTSPLGPFVQDDKKPMFAEKAIDSSIFVDEDGTPYIYFVRFTDGNVIWGAQLEKDWSTIKEETLVQCVVAQEDWETKEGKVAEGPSVTKKDGIYYLIYSANDFRSQDYAVGFATATRPLGEWTKSDNNPILHKPHNGLLGTGHGALFKSRAEKDMYVFHAHHNADSVHPRLMYVLDVEIDKGQVTADENTIITPLEIE